MEPNEELTTVAYLGHPNPLELQADGPSVQSDRIKRFAMAHGLRIERIFLEESPSADRPAFSELLAYLEVNQADAVLVEHLGRFGDVLESELALKEFREAGVKVYAATDCNLRDLATAQPEETRKAIRDILIAAALWDKRMLLRRLRDARKRSGRRGGCKPYGALPGEKPVVQFIVQMHEAGTGTFQIAKTLQRLGVPTRRHGTWRHFVIRTILERHLGRACGLPH